MNKSTILFLAVIILSAGACAKEEAKPIAVTPAQPSIITPEPTPKENIKTICKDILDKNGKPVKDKNGTIRQSCKEIKIRSKYNGTPVPGQK